MEAGIFLVLCLLALFVGSRAKRSRQAIISPKARKQKEKVKSIIMIVALVVISFFLILYSPFLYQDVTMAIQTSFSLDNYLSIAILVVGVLTIFTLLKRLNIIKSSSPKA